ncbi:sensor histidine kinase [Cytobacillus solani]|uniref:sensor histidine kinase n=1 Tax=Cytobacillus solani TaxID=1637975 RepID=UPI0006AB87C0|nr:sensor histidine kinase [Cytobacillus solani]KOP83418.1 histidine kinase [Bacillus sp. FJAT-21945]USK53707.1 sensor histidine kinase [Cytobacillus solani]
MSKGKLEIFPARYGFFPYMFLIYLFMPGYYIYFETGWKLYAGYVLLGLFLVTYRQLYFAMKSFTNWLILQIAIVLFLSVFININIVFLGFFPAHFIGWYKEKKQFFTALILFGLSIFTPIIIHYNHLNPNTLFYIIPFILIMLFSPFGIRSMNSKMELERQLDEANERIEELVKREERLRIARDLHDTLGHTLSLITLKSQLVGKLLMKDIERAKHEVKEIERTSRAALSQVRELVSDMRAITIKEELQASSAILEAAGISFQYHDDSMLEDASGVTQNIVSMCLREAVTNVVKHSQAKNCHIAIIENAGEMMISIQDDGKGMGINDQAGNGLKGISERLELIDGALKITSHKGTKLLITVPVIVKEREGDVDS